MATTPAAPATSPDAHAGHGGEIAADAPSAHSLYHLRSEWTDQQGRTRTLEELAGRVQVVAMVYTHCGYACPRILMDMKRIEGEVGGSGEVGLVLVSVDPERDTPERLAAYARSADLDPTRWTLLSAPDGNVRELAALLGVRYRQTPDGEFEHSNVITVLDPGGVVSHQQQGLGQDPTATVRAIRGLLGE
ncbi:MAG TPA: SCO family protein [Longimicrobiales bacterium]|nr:SCO family protein [Longimicrobiales bacterium]